MMRRTAKSHYKGHGDKKTRDCPCLTAAHSFVESQGDMMLAFYSVTISNTLCNIPSNIKQ